jgi:hypothetical protein
VARVQRTDIGSLRPVERRDDGTIVVDALLTRAGVFSYRQPDGSTRLELRLIEDVSRADSLKSFEGRPVTNNHPPDMVDARNARRYAVGSVLGVPMMDGDHVRGRLSVYDGDTVGAMDGGKIEVSCGYTCDTLETPGTHPKYGRYDAIQKNIVGNHVAIVDRGRAGPTARVRMDGWCTDLIDASTMPFSVDGTGALPDATSMPQPKRIDAPSPDSDDEANRNAKGKTAAPVKDKPPASGGKAEDIIAKSGDDDGSTPKSADPAPDEDEPADDAEGDDDETPASRFHGPDGKLTPKAASKIAASSFAVPAKQGLPIHDPNAVRDSMKRFGSHEFDDADEKHAAFNRITNRATQFGMNPAAFHAKHIGKLDTASPTTSAPAAKKDSMTPEQIKELQDKAASRKAKLVAAKAKCDALEQELAAKDGQIAGLERDLEVAKTATPKTDAADADVQTRIDAMISLLDEARTTGATVDSKMAPIAIKLAVIKHVDSIDVAPEKAKLEPYVDALYDSAIGRSKKDAANTARGAKTLASARAVVPQLPVAKVDGADDEDDTSEEAAATRLRNDSHNAYARQESK